MTAPLLEIRDLVVEYPSTQWRKPPFRALQGVSLDILPGETVGLVGESGSGKTTLGRAVLGLAPVSGGSISFQGKDISAIGKAERRGLATEMQVIFQDPYTSLNPAMTVADILSEPLRVQGVSAVESSARIRSLLEKVGLPADSDRRLAREFSGGQRQRVAIARALALDPKLIVCDEPVSALDLSTQARVLDLLVDIQEETGVSYLFVSHDLAVIRHVSHRVSVMYHGEIVESGDAKQVTEHPEHPYTQRLWAASPVPDPDRQAQRRADRRRLIDRLTSQDEQAGAGLGGMETLGA